MKFTLVILLSLILGKAYALDSATPHKETKNSTLSLRWSDLQPKLIEMTKKFKNKKLSEKEKVKLLPLTNQYLSHMQDLSLNPAEEKNRIQLVVNLLAASLDFDFASSNIDTVYFDYKKNKSLYQAAISSLSDSRLKNELFETFKSFSKAEMNGQADEAKDKK